LIQSALRDVSVSLKAIDQIARRAPDATVKRYDLDHFQPFSGVHPARIAGDQVEWLRSRQLV
jgi:uncharacterized protein